MWCRVPPGDDNQFAHYRRRCSLIHSSSQLTGDYSNKNFTVPRAHSRIHHRENLTDRPFCIYWLGCVLRDTLKAKNPAEARF